MTDIYREITEIILSEFGWQMRDPMRRALMKLDKGVGSMDPDQLFIIANDQSHHYDISQTGDGVISTFIDCITEWREKARKSNGIDTPLMRLIDEYRGQSRGPEFRKLIYSVLQAMMTCKNASVPEDLYGTINYTTESMLRVVNVYVGNEESIFMYNGNPGIAIIPPETGFQQIGITVNVTNVITGDEYEQTYTVGGDARFQPLVFFDHDTITKLIHPGYLRITVEYNSSDPITISTDYCKFGQYEPVGPGNVTQFDIDVHNYDDTDGKIYDVSGRELTTMIVTGAGGAYADSEGLYLPAGNVIQWLDLNMPLDEEWTLTFRIKDVAENPQGYNQFIQLRNQENEHQLLAFVQQYQNPNLTWRELWQYCNFRLGSTLGDDSGVEVFNYAFHKYNGGTIGDIFDVGCITQEMLPWCYDVVFICDTHYVNLYVNGIIKARAPVSLFLEDMTKIIFGHPNNNGAYKILHCSLKSGIHMPESVVYKMRIKSVFGDSYMSLAKIGMYTGVSEGVGTGRFDYRTNNYVSGIVESATEIATGVQPTRPDVRSFPASLLDLPSCNGGANTINGIYHNGVYNWYSSPINVYFTVSLWALGNNAELTPEQANLYAFQFQTPDEPFPGRTPNSWELYKTLDGGLTWFKIDDRTITSQIPQNQWGPLMYPTTT